MKEHYIYNELSTLLLGLLILSISITISTWFINRYVASTNGLKVNNHFEETGDINTKTYLIEKESNNNMGEIS